MNALSLYPLSGKASMNGFDMKLPAFDLRAAAGGVDRAGGRR